MTSGNMDPHRRQSPSVAARQAKRREQWVAAAHRVVRARGLAGLSAATLGHETGTVPAALYRTFASMDALKGELVSRALDRLAEEITAMLQKQRAPGASEARERIERLCDAIPRLRARRPADHELVDAALSSLEPIFPDDIARAVEPHLQRVLAIADAVLDDAVRARALAPGDTRQRTLVLLAIVHGTDHLRKRDRLEPTERHAEAVRREAVRAVLHGWRT
jgi:AcrR family transcriptional regulator